MSGQMTQLRLPEEARAGRSDRRRGLLRVWEKLAEQEAAVKAEAEACAARCPGDWCEDCPLLAGCKTDREEEERIKGGWEARIKAATERTAAAFVPLIPYVKEWWTR